MLGNRTSGKSSRFEIPVVDDEGNKIDATSASWELFDARGTSITAGVVADFDASADTAVFTIDGTDLVTDGNSDGRELVVYLTTTDGEVELRDYFLVVNNSPLTLMQNSFMTYPEALAVRQGFGPGLIAWDADDNRDRRSGAMFEAYMRLLRMVYRLPILDYRNRAESYAAYGMGDGDAQFDMSRRVHLRGMSVTDFDALPEEFRLAIKRAQLVEADYVMGGDQISQRRRDGIISETVGESSTFYQSKPYLNLPISKRAYEELQRFIIIKVGVFRS